MFCGRLIQIGGHLIKVLVIGAGAIGGLVGGQLAGTGCQVTLLGRQNLRQAVSHEGLHLIWPEKQPQTVQPEVITHLTEWRGYDDVDLVLVTVKSFDTETATKDLGGLLPPKTRILSLQNGVGNEETLARLFPNHPIIAGSITLPVEVPQVGTVIVSKDKGGIGLAPMQLSVDIGDIVAVLKQAGFLAATYKDYQSLKWSKLMMNLACNAMSAILDMPPADLLANPALFDLELSAWREALQVMQAQKIKVVALPNYPMPLLKIVLTRLPNLLARPLLKPMMVGGRGHKLPSLQLELRRGQSRSEVNILNGAVAVAGTKARVAVPVNRSIYDILTGIISDRRSWSEFRANPESLLTYVYKQTKAQT